MNKIIQIRGCFGSGKSSAVRGFLNANGGEVRFITLADNKDYSYTICPTLNAIAGGRYDQRECGGIDALIHNANVLHEYVLSVIKKLSPEYLILDGVMYNNTFSFSYALAQIGKRYGYDFQGILMLPPLQTAIERIYHRNGGKPINVKSLESQYFSAIRSAEKLKQVGLNIKTVDTSKIRFENMGRIIQDAL